MTTTNDTPDYAELLREVVTVPGKMAECYQAFHHYSMGNQLLALWQIAERGLPIGPIASYVTWQARGRQVRKGEKALRLYMPITVKVPKDTTRVDGMEDAQASVSTRFILRPNWFTLAQTDAKPGTTQSEPEPEPADWDYATAIVALGISETCWNLIDGNCQGYALPAQHTIAINPLAQHPTRTRLHEVAHCLLHADSALEPDMGTLSRNEKELEAETTAYLVGAALGLGGAEESRAYVQHWFGSGTPIADKMARRILAATDKILTAGKPRSELRGH